MTRSFLLVTYHFPPSAASGSFRMLGLARHLPRLGWRPVVVAPLALPWEPLDDHLARQLPADTTVYHAPYPTGFLTRLGRKLLGPEAVWLRGRRCSTSDQLRARIRIWKLSKPSSATCNHA